MNRNRLLLLIVAMILLCISIKILKPFAITTNQVARVGAQITKNETHIIFKCQWNLEPCALSTKADLWIILLENQTVDDFLKTGKALVAEKQRLDIKQAPGITPTTYERCIAVREGWVLEYSHSTIGAMCTYDCAVSDSSLKPMHPIVVKWERALPIKPTKYTLICALVGDDASQVDYQWYGVPCDAYSIAYCYNYYFNEDISVYMKSGFGFREEATSLRQAGLE